MPTVRQKQQTDAQQLNNFGSDTGQFIPEDELQIAETIGGQFISRVKENIEAAGMINTGRIDNMSIQRTDSGFDIIGNNYLLFQDAGVNGSESKLYDTPFSFKDKRPPISAIKEWLSAKGLGNEESDSDAYAVAEKIFQEGIPPKNIMSREIPQLANDVAEATGNLVVNFFMRDNEH